MADFSCEFISSCIRLLKKGFCVGIKSKGKSERLKQRVTACGQRSSQLFLIFRKQRPRPPWRLNGNTKRVLHCRQQSLNSRPLKAHEISDGKVQFRKVSVPPHRFTPLKKAWMEIYTPVYEQMKIDIRMNLKARKVELKTRSDTPDICNLQKCADFVHAFMLGFDVIDAVALLRLRRSLCGFF